MRILQNDNPSPIHQPQTAPPLPTDERAQALLGRLRDVTLDASDCALGLYVLAGLDAWPEREGPSELAGRRISLCDASGKERFEVEPGYPPRIGRFIEETEAAGVRILLNEAGEFGVIFGDTPIWTGTDFWKAAMLACRAGDEQSPIEVDAHQLERLWLQLETFTRAEVDSVMQIEAELAEQRLNEESTIPESFVHADMTVIDMEAVVADTVIDIEPTAADTVIDMSFADEAPVTEHSICKSVDANTAIEPERSPEALAEAAKLGEKVLRDTLLSLGKQVYQRTFAQALDEMLQGTLLQGTQLQGLKLEHGVQLKDALQTFRTSEQPLPESLQRLFVALQRLPDDALLAQGGKLKACVQLCGSSAFLLREVAGEGLNLDNARRLQRDLLKVLDNPLLAGWSAVESLREALPQLDQGLSELVALSNRDLSYESVLGWVKDSTLFKETLALQYQGTVQLFDELGEFFTALNKTLTDGHGASPLARATGLLERVDSGQLGPLLTTHLSNAFAPLFDALHGLRQTLDALRYFPVGQSPLQQLQWLGKQAGQANLGQWLPEVLAAPLQEGISTLGNVQEVCKAIGAPPMRAPLGEQAKWLAKALDQPLPAGVEKRVAQVIGQHRFDTLNALGKQATSLQQHVARFPEAHDVFAVFRWANTLAQDTQAPALLERLLPASVQQEITAWSAPLEQAHRLAPQLADYPRSGGWQEKLGWAAALLTSDEAPALLQKLLPGSLAQPLVQPFEMIRLAQGFPTQASPLAQLRWTTGLLGSVQGQKALQAFAPAGYDQVFAQLDNLGALLQGVDVLRRTLTSDASLPGKLQGVATLLMQPLVDELKQHPEVLLKVASRVTGGNKTSVGMALTVLRLYLEIPAGLSRTDMLKHSGKELFRELAREFGGVVGLAADYGTPMLKAREYVQQAWELYQAWSESASAHMEQELSELVNLLKRDLPLPEGVQPLLDALPALPALLRARDHYSALPEDMALGEQTKQMAAHLAQSDSAALARVYDAIEAYAVGVLTKGLDRIMASVSDPLKIGVSVDAAPLYSSASLAGSNAVPQGRHSNALALTKALGGAAGFAASVAGGVWAWQHWNGRSASTYAPVADQEMKTFMTNQIPEASEEAGKPLRQSTEQNSTIKTPVAPQRKAQVAAAISLLGAVISTGFMANGIYELMSRQVRAEPTSEVTDTTLGRLEAEAREDFYAGDTHRMRDDIDRFLDRLEVDLPGVSTFTSTESAQETSTQPPPKQEASVEHKQRVRRSPVAKALLAELPQGDGQGRSTTVLSIDQLLPLMKEAHELVLSILSKKSEGQTEETLGSLYGRLGQVKNELVQLREDLAELSPDGPGEFLMNQEVYAYYQLGEMKAYFGDREGKSWNQFDPAALTSYRYTDAVGQPIIAQAPLIDFLNGRVAERLKNQEVDGGFDFPMRANSEVAVILQNGTAGYLPGRWTKEMALRDAAKQAITNGKFPPPKLTDLVTVKVQPMNPLGQTTGRPWQENLPLDFFIQNGIQTVGYIDAYDGVGIKWPDRYPPNLKNTLQSSLFREKYLGGDIAVADIQQRLSEVRKERLEAFYSKFEKYSNDDYLNIAEIITQYSWQDLVLNNDGTPIGFTESDVLAKAIDFVERQILHNEGERDKLPSDDDWRQDYQTEIDKLFGVLKVLHQKESSSLRLIAQSSAKDALIDTKVQEFVSASLREKAQRIAQHPHFKDLTADSPLTLKRLQGNKVTLFSMPLARVLGGEHERIATDRVRVEVEWPSGLSTADPLLQELIDGCTVYRSMQARGLAVKEAKDRLNVPTVMQQLQNGLERVVREEAPAGQKHASLKLTDTVNVRFTPMVVHNPEHSILKKQIPVVDKRFSLMQVMAKVPEREYIKMTHYRKLEVDTGKKFAVEVIQGLRDIDWQRKIESTVEELRQNKQLGEDWKLVFSSLIADKMAALGVDKAASLTLNGDRLPGVYMLNKTDGIELHSLFSKKSWTFDNLDKAAEALNKTDGKTTATLYAWLDEHRDAYEREDNSGGNTLSVGVRQDAGHFAKKAFGDLLDQMASDADTHLKSNAELNTHRVFQFLADVSPLIGLATMPISGPAAFLVSAGLASLPFAELVVADTKEEFKEIAVQAAITAAFEVGPTIVLTTLSKVPAKQIAKGIAQKLRGVGDDLFKGLKNTDPPLPTVRLEPLRQVPTGKVGNLAPGTNEYFDLLKKDPTIQNAIDVPAGKCEALLTPVATRIQQPDIGMTNIQYRATQLWSSASEQMPTHHFVVVGESGSQKYVFDLSARQFADKGMPDLNGPLILTEADWAQKYANASSRKLIKYKDFNNPRSAATEFHSYPGHSPKDVIDGGTLLTAPQWYKTLTQWNPTGVARAADDVVYAGLGRSSPMRDAARANMLSDGQGTCWDYASDVLREADILTPAQAKNLTAGLKKASNYHGMGESGRIDNLIADLRSVSNRDELLRVKQGELVVFMEVDPNVPVKGARPVHAMTSLGNGRFAGMKNYLLDRRLGDGKSILSAEELGVFRDNGFFRTGGGVNTPALEIKVGFPMGAKVSTVKSIREAAESLAREGAGVGKSWEFVADTLERSGELAREQADAFKELATVLCDPPRNSPTKALRELLVAPRLLANVTELRAVPKGHVVAISNGEFSAKHLMLSLGDGKFASAQLNTLDAHLSGVKGIVTAEELGAKLVDGKLGGFSLKTGPVNIEAMRVRSLLGKDSSFVLGANNVLSITTHGAPSIVNYMDAPELSHAIRGLIKIRGSGINLRDIRGIELNSCFGAMGRPSTGQVLADILNKEVKAYPLKYSRRIEANPEWWRPKPTTFKPRPQVENNAEALESVAKQSMRNHDFWDKWLGLYKQSRDVITSIRTKRETTDAFDSLLKDVSGLVMHEQGVDVDSFMQAHPEYIMSEDIATRAAVKTELNSILGLVKPNDIETFAQRGMEVLSLTKDAFDILNKHLSGER